MTPTADARPAENEGSGPPDRPAEWWVILATDRTELGAEMKAVKAPLKGGYGLTSDPDRARGFCSEADADEWHRRNHDSILLHVGNYLLTPSRLP